MADPLVRKIREQIKACYGWTGTRTGRKLIYPIHTKNSTEVFQVIVDINKKDIVHVGMGFVDFRYGYETVHNLTPAMYALSPNVFNDRGIKARIDDVLALIRVIVVPSTTDEALKRIKGNSTFQAYSFQRLTKTRNVVELQQLAAEHLVFVSDFDVEIRRIQAVVGRRTFDLLAPVIKNIKAARELAA